MNKRRTLLEELLDDSRNKTTKRPEIIEEQAKHVLSSVLRLMDMIDESFSVEDAEDLNKRLVLSIKSKDPKRFDRGISKIKESYNNEIK